MRIAYRGRRSSFSLGLANLRESAKKARDIYLSLLSEGWEATLAKYRSDERLKFETPAAPVERTATVGELISAASTVAEAQPRTLWGYGAALRRIAAGVCGVAGSKQKYGPKKGGAAKWRTSIDHLSLAELTDARVQAWKLSREKEAGTDPAARRRARNTFNSTLRQAKGLFSKKVLPFVEQSLRAQSIILPSPLPLHGVKPFDRQGMRYMSKIDPAALIARARNELSTDPASAEAWKIFLLAFSAGLRKREIDTLLWRQVDTTRGVITIETTEFFRPKSEESHGEIDLDPEVIGIIRAYKTAATGAFVIDGPLAPKNGAYGAHYRCDIHFERLNEWLRSQGITARKPLHELRKEAGSLVAKTEGLYGAQRFLRHASPSTTAAFYLDKKSRITPGIGRFLSEA